MKSSRRRAREFADLVMQDLEQRAETARHLALFEQFKRNFLRENPEHGPHLFATYQRLAKEIIRRAEQRGPGFAQKVKEDILESLIHPTHEHLKQRDTKAAVRNMTQVMLRLARQLDIPIPGGGGRFVPLGRAVGR